MNLATLWEMHGEAYFRRIEHAALKKFLDTTAEAVLATGGSLVMHPESFELLLDRATTFWLKARPQDHWNRVVAQGDGRPMKDRPAAMTELRGLLRDRRPFYAQASHVVDTSSLALEAAADAIVQTASRRAKS
jgi:XRE family aerobic/anaerobic benzoate catabolism transcriptional regulator